MPESFSFSTPEIMKKTTYRKEMKKKKGKLRDINQTNVFLESFMDHEDHFSWNTSFKKKTFHPI